MPEPVSHGQANGFACGYCHLPDGSGRPENASLAGLSAEYIARQLHAMRAGLRRCGNSDYLPSRLMVGVAKAANAAAVHAAARYFAALRYSRHVKIIEADRIPPPSEHGFVYFFASGSGSAELGARIVEGPDDRQGFELRDPRVTYTAYVPPGAIARGAVLAAGDERAKRPPCAACHGPDLHGSAVAPPIAGRFPTYLFRQLQAFATGARTGPEASPMQGVASNLTSAEMIDLAAYAASLDP